MTMTEIEAEAYAEIERRFKALGIDRKPRPAGLGSALAARHRPGARRWVGRWVERGVI